MSSHQQAMRPELLSHWWVQAAKLASQPAKLGPGYEQQINTAWHIRCTMVCKIPKHLWFSPLGSICANYIDGNSWPRTKLNQTDLREGCRGLGKMVIHLQCRMGRIMLFYNHFCNQKGNGRWQKPILTWQREKHSLISTNSLRSCSNLYKLTRGITCNLLVNPILLMSEGKNPYY